MIYEIIKEEDSTFSMRVYNSGAGIENHPSAVIGGKLKYLPFLEQKNIKPEVFLRPELWRSYYILKKVPPQPQDASTGAKLYSGFLCSIHPQFGDVARAKAKENFNPQDYINPQTAGVCTADSIFAFIHGTQGKKACKTLRNRIKFQTLNLYRDFLKNKEVFTFTDEALTSQIVQKRLDTLKFLETVISEFSGTTARAQKHGWITAEEAMDRKSQAAEFLDTVKLAERRYKAKFALSSPILQLGITDTSQLTFPKIGSQTPTLKALEVAEPSVRFTKPFELPPAENLADYLKDSLISNYFYLNKVMSALPSISDPYWDRVPPEKREACIEQFTLLLEHYRYNKMRGKCSFSSEDFLHVNKIIVLSKKLSEGLPDDKDHIGLCQFDNIFGSNIETVISSTPFKDPRLEKEARDLLKFFQNSENGQFDYNNILLDLSTINHAMGIKPSSEEEELPFAPYVSPEIEFACTFLKNHPEVQERLKHLSLLDQIGATIADNTGQILPKVYCNLKRQGALCDWFLRSNPAEKILNELTPRKDVRHDGFELVRKMGTGEPKLFSELWEDRYDAGRTLLETAKESAARASQNAIMCYIKEGDGPKISEQELIDFLLIVSQYDKSQQPLKVLLHFKGAEAFEKLKQKRYQNIFETLLFEPPLLRSQLEAEPTFADQLAEFITVGMERAKNLNDIQTGVFLLRMGSYLADYCKTAGADTKKFPDFLKEMDTWLQKKDLPDAMKSLLIREYLAAVHRLKSEPLDIALVLNRAFFLADNPISDYAPSIDSDVQKLLYDLGEKLNLMKEGERDQILSKAIDPAKSLSIKFKGAALFDGNDGQYKIDITTGKLYARGGQSSSLPAALSGYFLFTRLFPEGVTEVRTASGGEMAEFTDAYGRENRAFKKGGYDWKFQKKIGDNWCDFYPEDNFEKQISENAITSACSAWQDTKLNKIIFINEKGKPDFEYAFGGNLTCIDGGARNGLNLVDMRLETRSEHEKLTFQYFQNFDKRVEFWKDGNGKIKIIHLPSYQLSFEVEQPGNKVRPIPPQGGFYLDKESLLPSLKGFQPISYSKMTRESGNS